MSDDVRVGLEVHAYLDTRTKLFCPCPAEFLDAAPNTTICPVCSGQPGAKPMAPNARAIRLALDVARALALTPSRDVVFLRKHYFYPDQPVNYQRTARPLGVDGTLAGVRIREMHLEEDPGAYDPRAGTVDLDRAGVPLVEIVTEPDITSAAGAQRFLDELRLILDHLGVWRRGYGVKADVNVSIGDHARVEVKNVNTVRGVVDAIHHEVARQRAALDAGEPIVRETRGFDETTGTTTRLRTKESFEDYRFLPDPDLPPWRMPEAWVDAAWAREPPLARRARLAAVAGVEPAAFSPLMAEAALVDAFEALSTDLDPAATFQFLLRDVRAELEWRSVTFADARVDVDDLRTLVAALHAGDVTPHVATRLLRKGFDEGGLAAAVDAEKGAAPGGGELDDAVAEAIAANPRAVEDYHAGKAQALNFLMGQVMRILQGRAPPDDVRRALTTALEGQGGSA